MDFESWAAARLPALLGAARAMCGDRGTAEDVVQDVLARVYVRWDQIAALDAPDAYVRRMLVNEVTSWRDAASPHLTRVVPCRCPRRSRCCLHSQRNVTDASTGRDRSRWFADLSDDDIAASLGCAASTVRVHAARALAALRVNPALSPIDLEKETS